MEVYRFLRGFLIRILHHLLSVGLPSIHIADKYTGTSKSSGKNGTEVHFSAKNLEIHACSGLQKVPGNVYYEKSYARISKINFSFYFLCLLTLRVSIAFHDDLHVHSSCRNSRKYQLLSLSDF